MIYVVLSEIIYNTPRYGDVHTKGLLISCGTRPWGPKIFFGPKLSAPVASCISPIEHRASNFSFYFQAQCSIKKTINPRDSSKEKTNSTSKASHSFT